MKKTINNVRVFNGEKFSSLTNVDILRGMTVDAAKDISVCRNIQHVWVKGIEVELTK